MSTSVVLATTNSGKVAEIQALLPHWTFLARPPGVAEIEETAVTFVGNARLKAHALVAATGQPALADDSGLEVDALHGAPGVRSARFAGENASDADNVAKLLGALEGIPAEHRTAHFRTVIVLAYPEGDELVAEGSVSGHIVGSPRGANGFGYDPVFVADVDRTRTFAEMSSADKNKISHRADALRKLVELVGPGDSNEP